MSAEIRDVIRRLRAAGKSDVSISVTISLPIHDVRSVR